MELVSIGRETLALGRCKRAREGLNRTDDEEEQVPDITKCQLQSGYNHLALITGTSICIEADRLPPPIPTTIIPDAGEQERVSSSRGAMDRLASWGTRCVDRCPSRSRWPPSATSRLPRWPAVGATLPPSQV
jgi:hypothetical protein